MGYWLMDTAGIGSIVVLGVGLAVLAAYIYMVRWIQTAPLDPVSTRRDENIEAGGEGA